MFPRPHRILPQGPTLAVTRVRRSPGAVLTLAVLAGSASPLSAAARADEPFPPRVRLTDLLPANGGDGSGGLVLNGINTVDRSGRCVASAGDVNGDGIDDLLVGADFANPNNRSNAGQSYVVFGGPGVAAGGEIDLASLDGTNGFALNGIDPADISGFSVASAGDVNADGIGDLIISADQADQGELRFVGECYVVYGAVGIGAGGSLELSSLDGSNGFVIRGVGEGDRTGRGVDGAGDLNGDGYDDLIIGALFVSPGGRTNAGAGYVVFGGPEAVPGGVLELSALNGTNGFVINGAGAGDRTGRSAAGAGDVNGDGFADVILGAPQASPGGRASAGACHVVFGGPGVGASGTIELSSLDGSNGVAILGIVAGDQCGTSVAEAGDVNGDGYGDLIMGATLAGPNGLSNAGQSYVVFGGPSVGSAGVVELSSLNGSDGFVLNGVNTTDLSGHSTASAGDVNGDGFGDLIIGADYADPRGVDRAGESYIVYGGFGVGSSGAIGLADLDGENGFTVEGIRAVDKAGWSVAGAGDVNYDGVDDIIIGADLADPNGVDRAGQSYVVFGRPKPPCVADLNADRLLDHGDIAAFVGSYLTADPSADLTGDGVIDPGDIAAFLEAFFRGC